MIPPDILRLGPLPADTTNSDRRAADSEGWRDAWHREMERLQAKAWLGHGVVGGASAMAAAIPAPATARGTAAEATRAADPAAIDAARLQALAQPAAASIASATDADEPWMDGKPNDISIEIASNVDVAAVTRGPICDGEELPMQAPAVQALLANLFSPESTVGTPAISTVPALEAAAPPEPIKLQRLPLVAGHAANAKAADAQARWESQSASAAGAPTTSGQPQEPRPQVRVHAEWTADGVRLWLGIDADAAVSLASLLKQLQRCAAALGMRVRSVTCNGRPVPLQAAALPSIHQTEPEAFPWQLTQ